jgi:hypothetical protein
MEPFKVMGRAHPRAACATPWDQKGLQGRESCEPKGFQRLTFPFDPESQRWWPATAKAGDVGPFWGAPDSVNARVLSRLLQLQDAGDGGEVVLCEDDGWDLVLTIPLSPLPRPQKYLLFGKNGWIGGKLIKLLQEQGKEVVLAQTRLENRESVAAELDAVNPTHVLDAAGITGR